jgi:hypothetical protein
MEDFAGSRQRVLVQFGFRRQRRLVAIDRKRDGVLVQTRGQHPDRDHGAAQPKQPHRD